MSEHRATWFCIDIECNGPVPALYDMVSLGAVAVVPDDWGRLVTGPELYVELRPEAPRFDPHAARIHGLDQDRLAAEGLSRLAACTRIAAWVKEHTRPGTESVFVGHNAPFDWSFVAWTFHSVGMENPFGYKAMCTKSMAMGALGVHWLDTNKETLTAQLDLPTEDLTLKHRADYDARFQAQILIRLLERMKGG